MGRGIGKGTFGFAPLGGAAARENAQLVLSSNGGSPKGGHPPDMHPTGGDYGRASLKIAMQ